MSSTIRSLRAVISAGAVLMACGVSHSALAADTADQRVAMACTHGSDAAGCKAAPTQSRHTVAPRAEMVAAKAPVRRTPQSQPDLRDSDGSRFTYDSCGCSN